jgi:DNA polymerase-3 subunit delta
MHATAYLKSPDAAAVPPVVVLHGSEWFLKRECLHHLSRKVLDGDEVGLTRLPGGTVALADLLDELATRSMWSPRRLVVVEEADAFVKNHRAALEEYADHPVRSSVLVLDAASWPSNTRLAAKVAKTGLELACTPLKPAEAANWIRDHALRAYGKTIAREAAGVLIELVGIELGLLDQELAKLASYVGAAPAISVEAVRTVVGGWRAETTWTMIDAVLEGRSGEALALLDKLLHSGEPAMKLLGGIHFVFRPLGTATEISRRGGPLRDALLQGGVKPFNVDRAVQYLRRATRPRAEQILQHLASAESQIKGAGALPERYVLERLLLQLGGPWPADAPAVDN